MLDIALALGFGLLLGAATGIPLGVVNVAVVEAATRAGRRVATGIGAGGALADGIHAALAFAGVARLLERYPDVRRAMVVVSAAVVLAYAAIVWRRRDHPRAVKPAREAPPSIARGVGLGLSLTLPNPAALAAWVAVASAVPHGDLAQIFAASVGVAVGSASWFAMLAYLAGRHAVEGPAARRMARATAILLVAICLVVALRELA